MSLKRQTSIFKYLYWFHLNFCEVLSVPIYAMEQNYRLYQSDLVVILDSKWLPTDPFCLNFYAQCEIPGCFIVFVISTICMLDM